MSHTLLRRRRNSLLFGAVLLVAPLALSAQNDPSGMPAGMPSPSSGNQTGQPSSSTAGQMAPGATRPNSSGFSRDISESDSGGTDTQAVKDRMFLRRATMGGMAEIQFGQLAEAKAGSDAVKRFGGRMARDHGIMNDAMKPIAESLGVTLPSAPSKHAQEEYEKLNRLSGADFDREYLAYMQKDHHKDLAEFRQEEATVTDPTLKDAVIRGEHMIAQHTHIVDKLVAANAGAADAPAH